MAAQSLSCSMWDLVPWPGIEPGPPALGTQSLSPWATRDIPLPAFLTIVSSKSCPRNLHLPRRNSHNLTSRPSPCLTSPSPRLGFSFQSLSPYDMSFGPCPGQSPRELLTAHFPCGSTPGPPSTSCSLGVSPGTWQRTCTPVAVGGWGDLPRGWCFKATLGKNHPGCPPSVLSIKLY